MSALHPSTELVYLPFGKYKGLSVADVARKDRPFLERMASATALPHPWPTVARMALTGDSIEQYQNTVTRPVTTTSIRTCTLMVTEKGRVSLKYAFDKANAADVEFKEYLKKAIPGIRYDGKPHYVWTVPASALPAVMVAFGGKENLFASDDVKALYREEMARKAELNEIRATLDADIDIPTLLELYGYQKVAVQFAERAGGRALIGDQMGLGKTPTAIGYAVRNKCKTLVICPKSVVIGWAREIKRFAGEIACVWTGSKHTGNLDAMFHVINYDVVDTNLLDLLSLKFDLLVCDEATYIKNHKSARSKAIMGSWKERKRYPGIKTKHLLLLTGTPILNKPIEAFQLLNFLSKERFGNVLAFIDKYGGNGEKPRNLDDLHERTKDLMIRRRKSQVRQDMPAKLRIDIPVEMPPAASKAYNKLLDDMFRKWNMYGRPSAAQMPVIQRFLLPYKLQRAYELVDELQASGQPVIVFSQFRDPIRQVKEKYGNRCGMIMGGMSGEERQEVIDGLRDGKYDIGAFTLKATNMGIDGLQHRISTAIFLDRFFVPAVHEQAEDRLHRDGQKETVTNYYLTVQNTIDEMMAAFLIEKQTMIDKVVDGGVADQTESRSFFRDLAITLRDRHQDKLKNVKEVDSETLDLEEYD